MSSVVLLLILVLQEELTIGKSLLIVEHKMN